MPINLPAKSAQIHVVDGLVMIAEVDNRFIVLVGQRLRHRTRGFLTT